MQKEHKEKLKPETVKAFEADTGLSIDDFVCKKDGEYVPRETMNKEIEKKTTDLNGQIEKLNAMREEDKKALATLKKAVEEAGGDAEKVKALENKIEELETAGKERDAKHDAAMLLQKKQTLAERALVKAGCQYPGLMLKEFDWEKVNIDGDPPVGIDEQVELLKAKYPPNFDPLVLDGDDDETGGGGSDFTGKTWGDLRPAERVKLKRTDPALYEKMRQAG